MSDGIQGERIARLETKIEVIERDISTLVDALNKLTSELNEIVKLFAKTKGIIIGSSIVTSIVWTIGIAVYKLVI